MKRYVTNRPHGSTSTWRDSTSEVAMRSRLWHPANCIDAVMHQSQMSATIAAPSVGAVFSYMCCTFESSENAWHCRESPTNNPGFYGFQRIYGSSRHRADGSKSGTESRVETRMFVPQPPYERDLCLVLSAEKACSLLHQARTK